MESKKVILKEIYQSLQDEKYLRKEKESIEKRVIIKMNSLGLKGSSYSEIVIKISGVRDKFSDTFSKVMELVDRREYVVKELAIIEDLISKVNLKMRNSSDLEYKVFSGRVIEGLSLQEIAKNENYTLDRIKQVSAEVSKKITCQ